MFLLLPIDVFSFSSSTKMLRLLTLHLKSSSSWKLVSAINFPVSLLVGELMSTTASLQAMVQETQEKTEQILQTAADAGMLILV